MQWDKLKTFHHVAQAGSFTRAGENLNLSQSSISRAVIDLESRLGYQLFTRHARGLELTEEGKILNRTTKRMICDVESSKDAINDLQQEPQGRVKLATTAGLATIIVENLAEFTQRYPKIQISIISEEDIRVAFQRADVGLYPSVLDSTTLIQKHISSNQFGLYASSEYLEKYGTPKTPQDLDNHRLVSYGNHTHPYTQMNWLLSIGSENGKLREPYMEFNSGLNLFLAAQTGIGIVTLAKINRGLRNSNLVEVLPDCQGPEVKVYYMYPEHLKQSKRIAVFGDYLREIFHDQKGNK